MSSKRFKKLPTNTIIETPDTIDILIPVGIEKLKHNNIIKAFNYSIDLLRIKSILINGAYVNANIILKIEFKYSFVFILSLIF